MIYPPFFCQKYTRGPLVLEKQQNQWNLTTSCRKMWNKTQNNVGNQFSLPFSLTEGYLYPIIMISGHNGQHLKL